ncbi:pollen-specific leucine-rich repeat extensin-like protein 4 [Iris pallida]|uniref:Pollen-specific leucine-rich repeat extensin-like protein 4 n=1 Tax=Iris pallida TaxID=29817 RepID=A0AAX6G6Z1_IRIPA|nr:pollen-specific leucine-rich repeat extensin-like protein 4 [Iris pallida]KAJ6824233.1 pollen-specific leucine-rich repeat extensin-like protein 4 [Iris pallida]
MVSIEQRGGAVWIRRFSDNHGDSGAGLLPGLAWKMMIGFVSMVVARGVRVESV